MFRLAFELLGAMVGAGFASGREIASFFTEGGRWSWLGIAAAVATLGGLLMMIHDAKTDRRSVWYVVLTRIMLIVTGGAMISCCGETAMLLLPVKQARLAGMIASIAAAWLLAQRTEQGLSLLSRAMALVLLLLMMMELTQREPPAVLLHCKGMLETLLRGIAWGGFNAALISPVMLSAKMKSGDDRRGLAFFCVMALLLLTAGNAVLMRNPGSMQSSAPFVLLANRWGRFGFCLSAACLLLAALTTLTAVVRGMSGNVLSLCGMMLVSAAGFGQIVDRVYPFLGAAGIAVIVLEARKTAGSPRDISLS